MSRNDYEVVAQNQIYAINSSYNYHKESKFNRSALYHFICCIIKTLYHNSHDAIKSEHKGATVLVLSEKKIEEVAVRYLPGCC